MKKKNMKKKPARLGRTEIGRSWHDLFHVESVFNSNRLAVTFNANLSRYIAPLLLRSWQAIATGEI